MTDRPTNLPTEKLANFRDLGGLKTRDGRTIREHCILRTAKLYQLPQADIDLLLQHGLKHIIDLRIENETSRQPDDVLPGVEYSIIPLREDYVKYQDKSGPQKRSPRALAKAIPTMGEVYKLMVTTDFSLDALRQIFQIIFGEAAPDHAILFHCTEGKDRTGILAALIERLLGVDEETVFEDYMLSNEPFEKRNKRYLALTTVLFHDRQFAKEFQDLYRANPVMLTDMLALINDTYGGVEPFFTDTLGFSQETIDAFRARVLE